MGLEEDDAESGLVAELRALAGAEGGGGDDGTFQVRRGRHTITVVHDAGSSSNLRLRVVYDDAACADLPALEVAAGGDGGSYRQPPSRASLLARRPLAITLDHETRSDARAVADGSRHELQTGDRAFDAGVFISAPTTNDAVLRAVLNQEVRAAVLSLFALGFLRVQIDDALLPGQPGIVEAYLWSFASREPPAQRGARCLDAFVRLLDHLPAITPMPSPAEVDERVAARSRSPGWVRALGWLGAVALLAGGPAWWRVMSSAECADAGNGGSLPPHCESSTPIALLVAFGVGVIASFLARPALIRRFGERSGSFAPIAVGRLKVLAGSAVLMFFLVFFVLLALRG